MISLLKILKEAAHVQLPKDYQKPKDDDFVTIPIGQDKETGRKSWDVVYTDPLKKSKRIMFAKTYQTIKKLADEFEYVSSLAAYKNDEEMHRFANELRTLEIEFKEYIFKKGKGV